MLAFIGPPLLDLFPFGAIPVLMEDVASSETVEWLSIIFQPPLKYFSFIRYPFVISIDVILASNHVRDAIPVVNGRVLMSCLKSRLVKGEACRFENVVEIFIWHKANIALASERELDSQTSGSGKFTAQGNMVPLPIHLDSQVES